MGNSTGNLNEYWDTIYNNARLQGAFIWDWVDQGITRIDEETGKAYWVYGGDFGDQPTDDNFCCNGLVNPDRSEHPGLREVRNVYSPVHVVPINASEGRFTLFNRYDFLNLQGFIRLVWELTYGRPDLRLKAGT